MRRRWRWSGGESRCGRGLQGGFDGQRWFLYTDGHSEWGIVVRMKKRTGIEEVLVVISATCGGAVIWLARTGLTRPLLRVKLPKVRTLAERQD